MGTMFKIWVLLSFLLFSPVAFSERCNPQDKNALLQIKKNLKNPYLLASWDPKTDCCDWYCVECDEKTNRIITLRIKDSVPYTNFSGQIPPGVANLPYLEAITLGNLPNLTGTIPPSIAKLTKLKYIFIEKTSISGPVPPFLAQLKNLELLYLSKNKLSGTIPSELSQLPNLLALRLDGNMLTGKIPDSFGFFKKGPDLYLSRNQLSGPIPASLAHLNPERIDLSRNKLEGDASVLFGANKRTQILDISRNLFSFDLSKVDFPKHSLIWLLLDHNKIYGSIPVGMTMVDNLQNFNVSYNQLCGKIPQGGRLQRFDKYSYFHNKCLCGPPLSKCK